MKVFLVKITNRVNVDNILENKVFIHDFHQLNRNVMQRVARAIVNEDCRLVTEKGWAVNTFNVCWMTLATARWVNHLRSAGMTYQGAQDVLV